MIQGTWVEAYITGDRAQSVKAVQAVNIAHGANVTVEGFGYVLQAQSSVSALFPAFLAFLQLFEALP